MKKTYAGETMEQILARNAAYDANVESLPEFAEESEIFDREYGIAKLMESARKHAKLTQTEIARRMGTTQSSIARMPKSNITISTLSRYLHACGARLKVAACYM